MRKQYFKCKLLTDIVVNASLATEGNMKTLDYIPGSNFLGIVAGKMYEERKLNDEELFDILHSNKVSFGDALISRNGIVSYAIPFSLFQDKLENGLDISGYKTWVHHYINTDNPPKDESGKTRQLKQQRDGYFNKKGEFINKVEKKFSLKSAHNRQERRSEEGKMFGFESILKGQEFIFSVIFDDDKYEKEVCEILTGTHRIGKSKTAQFGKVEISPIDSPLIFESKSSSNSQLVIYAESNCCFLNKYQQTTFQPGLKEFGLTRGNINWDKSQIRTYSYSPWNTKRNTTNTQRDVILKGSVIVIDNIGDVDISKLEIQVGEYNTEGLGRVIYNPEFLEANENAEWLFDIIKKPKSSKEEAYKEEVEDVINPRPIHSVLGNYLNKKRTDTNNELRIGEDIIGFLNTQDGKILKSDKITKSQWGAIRTKATLAHSVQELENELFGSKDAYLMHGVAAEKIWNWHRGKRRETLKNLIRAKQQEYNHDSMVLKFIAKLASQIQKIN